jgi:pyruvate formate lyase activating enzyme
MSLDRRRFTALLASGAVAAASPRRASAGRSLRVGQVVEGEDLPALEASWYKKLEEGRVECQLCPQACTVADAERGTCGARENRGGTYFTLVHSLACSIHADPIEKKPFFHVMPGELALSYATAGCNVECKFCQNWEISQFRPEQVRSIYLPPEALVEAAKRAGARLTAATYSEPVIFWEYVRDAARAAKKAGLAPTVVSNGFIQEAPLREVLPLLKAVKVDLKSFREEFYRDQLRGKLEPVLKALEIIRGADVWLEIVVLLIPTLNDSEAEVRDLSKWVKANLGPDVPIHFTRFHPTYRLTDLPPTPVATLERSWKIARAEGLNYVYLGNLPTHPAENTVCPGCGEVLIRRLGFKILENQLKQGSCPACERTIPGVWR